MRVFTGALSSVVAIALGVGCDNNEFYPCGVAVMGGSNVFRDCTGDREVCICATRSCAVHDDGQFGAGSGSGIGSDGRCESGFRYTDNGNFAGSGLAGTCVPADLSGWRITSTTSGQSCESLRDAGTTDSGSGSGSGSGSAL